MTRPLYLDTSIWIDYMEKRGDASFPLWKWTMDFLSKAIINKWTIMYSDLVIEEIIHRHKLKEIDETFSIFYHQKIISGVKVTPSQAEEAGREYLIVRVPFPDILHAIVARDHDAILITRDKHFNKLRHIVENKKPEELV